VCVLLPGVGARTQVRSYVVRELAARLRPELEAILKETDNAPGGWARGGGDP